MTDHQTFLATTAGEETYSLVIAQKPEIYRTVIAQAEAGMIRKMLELTNGNISASASALGINRLTIAQKIDKYKLRGLCAPTGDHNASHFATKKAIARAAANQGETA